MSILPSNSGKWPQFTSQMIPFAEYRHAAVEVLGDIHWDAHNEGTPLKCPGEDQHSTPSAVGHCRVYLNDGWMGLTCFHSSCLARRTIAIEQLKRKGAEIWRAYGSPRTPRNIAVTCAVRKSAKGATATTPIAVAASLARRAFPIILARWAWPLSAVKAASKPIPAIADQTYTAMGLFKPGDVVWSGEKYDSGHWWAKKNFRTRERWLSSLSLRGPLICPSVFKPGSYARKSCNIVERRFLILESDTLPHDHACAVYNWFMLDVGWNLRCIVDSGGKSLHAWFDYPGDIFLGELKGILPAMGFDPSMLRANQCCRLPGVMRKETGRYQEMIYLA